MPFVYWGFLVTFVVVIVLLIRWQIRYAGLVTMMLIIKVRDVPGGSR